jgi:hypothetical protein
MGSSLCATDGREECAYTGPRGSGRTRVLCAIDRYEEERQRQRQGASYLNVNAERRLCGEGSRSFADGGPAPARARGPHLLRGVGSLRSIKRRAPRAWQPSQAAPPEGHVKSKPLTFAIAPSHLHSSHTSTPHARRDTVGTVSMAQSTALRVGNHCGPAYAQTHHRDPSHRRFFALQDMLESCVGAYHPTRELTVTFFTPSARRVATP